MIWVNAVYIYSINTGRPATSCVVFVTVPGGESEVVEELSVCGAWCPLALMRCLMGLVGAAWG